MYEFKMGDKVRIRDDIVTLESEPPSINREMRQMGGKVCTIQDAGRTNGWNPTKKSQILISNSRT